MDPIAGFSQADVVVAGGGPGGVAAALVAARLGSRVVLIEATDRLGGNAAMSSGYVTFVAGEVERDDGVVDSPQLLLDDLVAEVERQRIDFDPFFDRDLAAEFAGQSRDAYEFLSGLGVEFGRHVSRPLQQSADRMVSLVSPSELRTAFESAARSSGVGILFKTRTRHLIFEAGRVVGIIAQTATGADLQLLAHNVVLATGGYQASPALRRRYLPQADPNAPFQGLNSCVGDGQLAAEEVGASLVNMSLIPQLVRVGSRVVEASIAVNCQGNRFHNEPGPYRDRVLALRAQPEGRAFYICDAHGAARNIDLINQMPVAPQICATVPAAAQYIGCRVETLVNTLETWNRIVASGTETDPQFGRVVFPDPREGISEPPFYVMPMVVGASFTAGGVRVTSSMQVIGSDRNPVPGLFAVGDCVGSVLAAAGVGGLHISWALVSGMIAGRACASSQS
jgi:succinate dehydrogenase/fumarate reductase flavoprotein subunit